MIYIEINVYVRVEKKDRSVVVEKKSDLVLDNFASFMELLLVPVAYQGKKSVSMIDTTGTQRTVIVGYDGNCWDFCQYAPREYRILIGFGKTPPTPSDYTLEDVKGGAVAEIYDIEKTDTYIRVTLVAGVQSGDTGTIWEVGLELRCTSEGGSKYFLLCRDVLDTGIDVRAGEYVMVYYTFEIKR